MNQLMTLAFAFGLCATATAQPKTDEARTIRVRFFGGVKKVPLEGLSVALWRGPDEPSMKKITEGTTDKAGSATFRVTPDNYRYEIKSAKEIPYLALAVGYVGHAHHFSRWIKVTGDATFDINLADACKLTLRVVDADTGKGVPGIEIVTENALGEIWGQEIGQDNIGAKPIREGDPQYRTDKEGNLVRLLGPRMGYTYYPWIGSNYEMVGKWEVEVPTPNGKLTAEHTFKVRKKAK